MNGLINGLCFVWSDRRLSSSSPPSKICHPILMINSPAVTGSSARRLRLNTSTSAYLILFLSPLPFLFSAAIAPLPYHILSPIPVFLQLPTSILINMSLTIGTTLPLRSGASIPQLGFGVYQSTAALASSSSALKAGYLHIDSGASQLPTNRLSRVHTNMTPFSHSTHIQERRRSSFCCQGLQSGRRRESHLSYHQSLGRRARHSFDLCGGR